MDLQQIQEAKGYLTECAAIGALVVAPVSAWWFTRRERAKALSREERKDAIAEWQQLVDKHAGEIETLKGEVAQCHKHHAECREEQAANKIKIEYLERAVERIENGKEHHG